MQQELDREKLRKPLPSEAISPHPSKSYLSTIKAIYVVERLNDVFGIGGWKVQSEFIEKADKMVVVKSVFTCGEIYVEAFGGNDNTDLGDAYKGACTDALTKIGSYLEIGIDVFKGLATPKPGYSKPVANERIKEKIEDDKPWIDDENFYKSITRLLEKGTITKDTPIEEVMTTLRTKFKVAKKYSDLVSLAISE